MNWFSEFHYGYTSTNNAESPGHGNEMINKIHAIVFDDYCIHRIATMVKRLRRMCFQHPA